MHNETRTRMLDSGVLGCGIVTAGVDGQEKSLPIERHELLNGMERKDRAMTTRNLRPTPLVLSVVLLFAPFALYAQYPGDLNCDGTIDMGDINPYVLALTNPAAYQATYPDCDVLNADLNGDGEVDFGDINPFVSVITGTNEVLQVMLNGLGPLGPGYDYEGWLIVNGMPVSTGVFSVDEAGNTMPTHSLVKTTDVVAATAFVLTIEPSPDPDPAPSATHVLGGDWDGMMANLTIGHPAALGDDFTSATGAYILTTPTTADIADDYDQGIWWVDPGAGGPSLVLPTLPAGWAYEGWIGTPDGPISTGRFLTPAGADSDGGGPAAGPDPAPPFPGQDFIDPPLSLIGLAAVISVEPEPDDSPAPFAIKPLLDTNIEDIPPPTLQSMANNAAAAPTGTAMVMGAIIKLGLNFTGLQPLGAGYDYEGWLIVNGNPVSTGTFSVDGAGHTVPNTFFVRASDAAAATAFVLTIEPSPDPDPAPSATHVLAGDWDGMMANLTIGHPAALGDDFTSATGAYILTTPTTADIADDYNQGIWWVDPGVGGPSLVLPTLPAGWAYEGWIGTPDGPISTGRFLTPAGADSDGGGPAAGPDPAPPFPGQDFIDPPLSLIGLAAVISVEPEPDDSPAPFAIKPLLDTNIEDIPPPTLQGMANNAASAPTGLAYLK
jgi:hypothetical protein